ncbi:hypothetical protein TNCV_1980311 [Trichonephila clavipes]|nr:hypothetical protein TNCV_1980311 [Trichonephila clavipes]
MATGSYLTPNYSRSQSAQQRGCDGRPDRFIQQTSKFQRTGNFPLIADGLQTFDVLPSSTGNFLLLVHRLQTFDVLPSSTGNFPLIVNGLQTFDVLSRRSAKHSLQCRCISFFFWSTHTYDRRTLFS